MMTVFGDGIGACVHVRVGQDVVQLLPPCRTATVGSRDPLQPDTK